MARFPLRTPSRIFVLLAAVLLLAALALVASFWSYRQIEDTTNDRKHNYLVIDYAEDLLSTLLDAETSQRGYLLTGKETFLAPYLAAHDDVSAHLEKLRRVATSDAARKHLDTLVPLVFAKLAEMANVIALRRDLNTSAAIALVAGGQGKLLMDSIRAEVKGFMQIEHASLAQHEAQALLRTSYLFKTIVAAILVALLLGLLTVYFVYLEAKQRFRNLVLHQTQDSLKLQQELSERLMQSNASLQISQEKIRLFADNTPAMTAFFDPKLICSFANKRFARFFGDGFADVVGQHLREIVGATAFQEIEGYFDRALQGYPVTYQRTRQMAGAELRYLEVELLPQRAIGGQATGCFVVTSDITEHKLVAKRIQRVAHHDVLTGLPNRLLFNDRLAQAISLAKRDSSGFALLFIDLDKFKPVNDTFGHAAGDQLLQGVATRIRCEVRESDTVARVGGDEFVVILPEIATREVAQAVAQKIIASIAFPFQLGIQNQSVKVGASIGIAIYPSDATDADALIKAADIAMYSAKLVGGGVLSCNASQAEQASAAV